VDFEIFAGYCKHGFGVWDKSCNHVDVTVFVDSDYAKDSDKGRSITGYAFLVQGCVVSWKATLQHVVALSITEAGKTLTSCTLLNPKRSETPLAQIPGFSCEGWYTLGEMVSRMSDTEMEERAEAWFGAYWAGSDRVILDKGDLRDYWIEISSDRDFLRPAPSYVFIRDPVRRLCHRMIAYSISGRGQAPEKYLFRHAEGKKSEARLSGGYFIGHLAAHFRLVAPGPKRQQVAVAGAYEADKAGPAIDKGAQEVLAPAQEPPPTPQPRTMSHRIDGIEGEMRELRQSVMGLRGVVKSSITEQNTVSTWMISCMTQLMDATGCIYQAFDNTLVGSS
ncbi:reverse transcriptase domain-containing protein, partial [Tanacetum coccineum]